jgi:predicted HTH domain antitoxin
METTTVELPTALLKAAKLDSANISKEAARLLALELFREDSVSLGRAVELCETPLAAFMDFVAKHGISPLRSTFDELEEDRAGQLSGFNRELGRRLASLDSGEKVDPAASLAKIERRSQDRRKHA